MARNLTSSMVEENKPINETLTGAIFDDFENITTDGAEFNQTGLAATAIASATKIGLMSTALFSKLSDGFLTVAGSYTGDGGAGGQEITISAGDTIKALLVFGNGTLWVSLGSGKTMAMAAGGNAATSSVGLAINSATAGKFTAKDGNGGPNTVSQTYDYIAFLE